MALKKKLKTITFTAGVDDKTSSILKDDRVLEILENANVKTLGMIKKRPGATAITSGVPSNEQLVRIIQHDAKLYGQAASGKVYDVQSGELIGENNRQWVYEIGDRMSLGAAPVVAMARSSEGLLYVFYKEYFFHDAQVAILDSNGNWLDRVSGSVADSNNLTNQVNSTYKHYMAIPNQDGAEVYLVGLEKLPNPNPADNSFITFGSVFYNSTTKALQNYISGRRYTSPVAELDVLLDGFYEAGLLNLIFITGATLKWYKFDLESTTSNGQIPEANITKFTSVAAPQPILNAFRIRTTYNIPGFQQGWAFVVLCGSATDPDAPKSFRLLYINTAINASQSGPELLELPDISGEVESAPYKDPGMTAHFTGTGVVTVFSRLANFGFDSADPSRLMHYRTPHNRIFPSGPEFPEYVGTITPMSLPIEQDGAIYYLGAIRDDLARSGDSLALFKVDQLDSSDHNKFYPDKKICGMAVLCRYNLARYEEFYDPSGSQTFTPPNVLLDFSLAPGIVVVPIAPPQRFKDTQATILTVMKTLPTAVPDNIDKGVDWLIYKGQLVMAGSYLAVLQGSKLRETAFLYGPQVFRWTYKTTGGNLKPGVYLFKFTFVTAGNDGQTIESEPSPAVTVVIPPTGSPPAETNAITLHLDGFYHGRFTEYSLNCYASEVNGSIFYRVASILGGHRVFSYTKQEDDHIQNPILYTASGQDGNAGTQACRFVEVFDNRLAITGGTYYDRVLFSKPESMEFYESEVKERVARGNYSINGLMAMDNRLFVFKQDMVLAIAGPGPDIFSKGRFRPAQELPYKNGLRDERSLVLTPQGIFYRSLEGTYLIDRGLNLHYIGSPVEADNAANVVEAEVMDSESLVLFFTPSKTLVYDYVNKIWLTYTGQGYNAATNFGGVMHYSKGAVTFAESPATFTDGGTAYSLRFRTAWLNLAGIMGFQRIWRATLQANNLGPYTLTLHIRYDYQPAIVETLTFSADGDDPEIEFLPARQRAKGIQLEFVLSGDNANAEITGLEFLVGVIGPKNRISATKRGT